MKFLLDTNAVIALMKGHPHLLAHLKRHQPGDFAISSIVAHELFYGAFKGQRCTENLARVDALRFVILEFDQEDARKSGELRAELSTIGTPVGPYDVLIAGQAWARGLVLVTRNTREFARISQIRIENWEDNP